MGFLRFCSLRLTPLLSIFDMPSARYYLASPLLSKILESKVCTRRAYGEHHPLLCSEGLRDNFSSTTQVAPIHTPNVNPTAIHNPMLSVKDPITKPRVDPKVSAITTASLGLSNPLFDIISFYRIATPLLCKTLIGRRRILFQPTRF